MTARVRYEVISSGLSIRYQGESNGEIFAIAFPGPLGDDEASIEKISGLRFQATSGSVVDVTDLHSRIIAYLGDDKIEKSFQEDTSGVSYKNVVFLKEQDGYLTNMLCGFQYFTNGVLEENGPYTYYPVYNWGTNIMRSVMDVVKEVPEGYKIRRVVRNEDNLWTYRGSQVLEKYTGKETVINVPMGVTDIAFKGKQGDGAVTSLVLPESVVQIDVQSVAECLPRLQKYEVPGRSSYRVTDGVLYSGDGKTLLSVPAGKTNIRIPAEVTAIAEGAFRNSSIRELSIPGTVTTLEKGCFDGFRGDVIRIEGEKLPKSVPDTGYNGKILFLLTSFLLI